MKRMFLAALTAVSLAGYTYAQDEYAEYEEEYEETTAQEEAVEEEATEEEEPVAEAPAPKAKKSAPKKAYKGPFLGIGMGLTTDFNELNLKFRLNEKMMVTAILGINHHGETTTSVGGVDVEGGDDYTQFAIGAGFDYYLTTPLLPTSAGVELIYASEGEQVISNDGATKVTSSPSTLSVNLMFGAHADIVSNFTLSGKVGLGIDYISNTIETSNAMASASTDVSRLDFGFKAGVYATWFFL